MKKRNTQLVVAPSGARHHGNGEHAAPGEAATAVNVRMQEASLVVTGAPEQVAAIPAGHRLLLVDGEHYFTLVDDAIYCDGALVTRVDGVVAMHLVGSMPVVVTREGLIHMRYSGGTAVVVSKADAVPRLSIAATEPFSTQNMVDAMDFAAPYGRWASPLAAADVATLTSRYHKAWTSAHNALTASGAYSAPVSVCYGVRMWDDNYLWISDAVTVGLDTLDNAQPLVADAVQSGGTYTGVEAAVLSTKGYRLGITVGGGVGEQWKTLVKAIDIFATAQPAIAMTSSLNYRCIATQAGQRVARLEYGWQPLSREHVQALLESSGWTMVASTSSLVALDEGRFEAPNVSYVPSTASCVVTVPMAGGATLTREAVAAVQAGDGGMRPVASMVRNGRLYTASVSGMMAVSAHGNATVTTEVSQVTGAGVMAIAPVSRPLYSGGFGRYAVYLFTGEGIYAVAQSALGTLGEARLVDRSVIAPGCVPVDGDRDVYYVDRHGWLCRLTGSTVARLLPEIAGDAMITWDDAHGELHVTTAAGYMLAVTRDGYWSRRTVGAVSLYDDVTHSLAVTASGAVLDLASETPRLQPLEYQSHPLLLDHRMLAVPRGVSWCVISDQASLQLSLHGERGTSCHGFLVSRLNVDGSVQAPLSLPLLSPPCRSVRFSVSGRAYTGTVIHEFTLTL